MEDRLQQEVIALGRPIRPPLGMGATLFEREWLVRELGQLGISTCLPERENPLPGLHAHNNLQLLVGGISVNVGAVLNNIAWLGWRVALQMLLDEVGGSQ